VIEVAQAGSSPAEKPLPKTVGLAPDLGV